jgi:CRP/FNR family transcriptional regulator, anaerobic regulatory protein
MTRNQITSSSGVTLHRGCQECSLSKLCIPIAVSADEISKLEEIIRQGRMHSRGDYIFEQHSSFKSCFAVRSGAIKTFTLSEEGEEQVTGFYLPGEIIGLDSVSMDSYSCSAVALERTSVCEIPLDRFEDLSARIPSLQHHFFLLLSKEIQESRQLSMLLSKNTAEERIASLLLSLSSRFQRRRLSETRFKLPMPRSDIGNYLGLAVETVSRVLTRFQNQGLIKVQGRDVEILDLNSLQVLLKHEQKCPEPHVKSGT